MANELKMGHVTVSLIYMGLQLEIQLINEELLAALRLRAQGSERLRQNFDLRTTPADGSQRMLNVLEPGTKVLIHRHEETTETVICLKGRLECIF